MSVVDEPAPRPAVATPTRRPTTEFAARLCDAGVRHGERWLLPVVSLEVARGETVAIVGRSGAGKTTLLHLIAGLLTPTHGSAEAVAAALMPQRDG
ncbi:MAG: ATP-binding cassette domain-containing protein, partial [Patulibacter sp.]